MSGPVVVPSESVCVCMYFCVGVGDCRHHRRAIGQQRPGLAANPTPVPEPDSTAAIAAADKKRVLERDVRPDTLTIPFPLIAPLETHAAYCGVLQVSTAGPRSAQLRTLQRGPREESSYS